MLKLLCAWREEEISRKEGLDESAEGLLHKISGQTPEFSHSPKPEQAFLKTPRGLGSEHEDSPAWRVSTAG